MSRAKKMRPLEAVQEIEKRINQSLDLLNIELEVYNQNISNIEKRIRYTFKNQKNDYLEDAKGIYQDYNARKELVKARVQVIDQIQILKSVMKDIVVEVKKKDI